ncbi:MAG TPA: ABC transporter substrate-binding protein [Chloroflexota bacterium]|nr:ABC transporter substrate-binding protein [Chloroflexota bacterium]
MNRRSVVARIGLLSLFLTACGTAQSTAGRAPAAGAPPPTSAVPAAPPAVTKPTQTSGLRTITVDFAAKYAHYAAHFIAIEKGYYAEEGLAINMVNGGVAPLIAGQTDFTTSPSALLTAILKGGDAKIVYTNLDRPSYQFWSSQAGIKTLQDLSGKSVGVLTRGDTYEISTRLLLLKTGLDPNGVAYTALGTPPVVLASLEAGSVTAAMLPTSDANKYTGTGPKGFLLADTTKEIRMLFNGAGTSGKLLREEPAVVEGFLRGTIKGREYFRRFKNESVAILNKYNGGTTDANAADYDTVLATMTDDGTLSDDVATTDAKVRAGLVGVDQIRPLSEIYDFSFVKNSYRQLRQSGWQPQR